MARTGVEVEGLRETIKALEQIGVEVDDLKDAFSKIATEGAEIAADLAPNVSGKLAGSLRGNRAKAKAVITAGRSTVPYAGPINYGWPARNISAAGFMQAADTQLQPVAVQRLEAEINATIQRKGLS